MNIIITGATKGIGRAITDAFAAEGCNLAICARTAIDLDTYKKELKSKFSDIQVLTKVVDMSKKDQVLAFTDYIKSQWDRVDVLVNNAGVYLPGEVHKEEDGILEHQINTNLYSAYHMTRGIIPLMLDKAQGHIFNMCSIASLIALPGGGSYSISKFALLGFSKVLREEMKDKGVKVTSIMPGATWSASWTGIELPEDRLMQAKDIADAVLGAWKLGPSAVVEEIVIRPQLGDL